MSKQQKIEDYVPVLYNINFDTKKGCDSHTCKKGKCICMDEEQASVLTELSNVFWKDVDVSSEALAKMEDIAKFR